MKMKIALLMFAVLGSAALVSPAQQANKNNLDPYASRPDQVDVVEINKPPMPPQPPVTFSSRVMRPAQAGPRNVFYTISSDMGPSAVEAQQLAQKYAVEKSESGREKIKSQLTDLLKDQFDARQKRHQEEIKELEDQIKKLKDLIEKRQENRQEIIARRLDQMLREAQGLGW